MALIFLVVTAACAGPSGSKVLVVDDARFRVRVPDGWDSLATDRADWADHATVALLANQRLDPQCASVASGKRECTTPVASLRDGALLVWWRSTNCAGSGCELPDGDHLLVGGRQAVRLGGTHLCDELGATREDAYLVTVTPQRVDAIVACDRDASEALRTQLADMLERVAWRTP